jgi:hypothetical protein
MYIGFFVQIHDLPPGTHVEIVRARVQGCLGNEFDPDCLSDIVVDVDEYTNPDGPRPALDTKKPAHTYANGVPVLVHHVDDTGREFPATVCGIAAEFPTGDFYIIHLVDPRELRLDYAYACVTMPEACLKPR